MKKLLPFLVFLFIALVAMLTFESEIVEAGCCSHKWRPNGDLYCVNTIKFCNTLNSNPPSPNYIDITSWSDARFCTVNGKGGSCVECTTNADCGTSGYANEYRCQNGVREQKHIRNMCLSNSCSRSEKWVEKSCPTGTRCEGNGQCVEQAVCQPKTVVQACANNCGSQPNGCGGTINCGTSRSCSLEHGKGAQGCYYGTWYTCNVQECDSGYYNEGNRCVSSTPQACTVEHGRGSKNWDGKSWSSCQVIACDSGYQKSGNSCITAYNAQASYRCDYGPLGQHVYWFDSNGARYGVKAFCTGAGYAGKESCRDGNVWDEYTTVGCSGNSCSKSTSDVKKQSCSFGCSNGQCNACTASSWREISRTSCNPSACGTCTETITYQSNCGTRRTETSTKSGSPPAGSCGDCWKGHWECSGSSPVCRGDQAKVCGVCGGSQTNYYVDQDSDGYARGLNKQTACSAPSSNWKPEGTLRALNVVDCNDNDADRNPGKAEVCDAKDNDCDGSTDEGNVCKKDNGAVCTSDSQCTSGYCFDSKCVACKQNSHCPTDSVCYGIDWNEDWSIPRSQVQIECKCKTNTCGTPGSCSSQACKKDNGQLCLLDNSCKSGVCKNSDSFVSGAGALVNQKYCVSGRSNCFIQSNERVSGWTGCSGNQQIACTSGDITYLSCGSGSCDAATGNCVAAGCPAACTKESVNCGTKLSTISGCGGCPADWYGSKCNTGNLCYGADWSEDWGIPITQVEFACKPSAEIVSANAGKSCATVGSSTFCIGGEVCKEFYMDADNDGHGLGAGVSLESPYGGTLSVPQKKNFCGMPPRDCPYGTFNKDGCYTAIAADDCNDNKASVYAGANDEVSPMVCNQISRRDLCTPGETWQASGTQTLHAFCKWSNRYELSGWLTFFQKDTTVSYSESLSNPRTITSAPASGAAVQSVWGCNSGESSCACVLKGAVYTTGQTVSVGNEKLLCTGRVGCSGSWCGGIWTKFAGSPSGTLNGLNPSIASNQVAAASGAASDPDRPSESVQVHFYQKEPSDTYSGLGRYIGPASTTPGNNGRFSFSFTPQTAGLREGTTTIHAYALNIQGTPGDAFRELSGSPKQILITSFAGIGQLCATDAGCDLVERDLNYGRDYDEQIDIYCAAPDGQDRELAAEEVGHCCKTGYKWDGNRCVDAVSSLQCSGCANIIRAEQLGRGERLRSRFFYGNLYRGGTTGQSYQQVAINTNCIDVENRKVCVEHTLYGKQATYWRDYEVI